MIEFFVDENHLLLSYTPERDPEWVFQKFDRGEPLDLKKSFHLQAEDQRPALGEEGQNAPEGDEGHVFILAERSGEYFKLNSRIMGTRNAFYFHENMQFSARLFVAERNISIIRQIDKLVSEDVYVGGTREDAMPESAYSELIQKFPTSYEMTKYALARVGACLRDYFETASDTERLYQKYMNKRVVSAGSEIIATFLPNEIRKYQTILAKLEEMLEREAEYNERQWQGEILDIIRLLYPKYINVFREAAVWDPIGKKDRYIDFLLVDSCGNIDIIEIKRPFDNCIVSRRQYRDNYIPMKELSGTIMQLEKYIFYLSRCGQRGEERLSERYSNELPPGLRLKIINPRGIVIMGRENTLTASQQADFEIIKRKYKSVIDIVTYDDLLGRLKFTVSQLEASVAPA
jgi:hypothetical protein